MHFGRLFTDNRYSVTAMAFHRGTSYEDVLPPKDDKSREQIIDMKLRSADSSIAGIVVDETGKAVPDAEVVFSGPGVGMQKVRTDRTGHFRFSAMYGTRGYLYLPAMKEKNGGIPMASTVGAGDSDLRLVLRPIPHN